MIRTFSAIVMLGAVLCAGNICAQQCSATSAPAEKEAAVEGTAEKTPPASAGKKTPVDEKVLQDIKRQIRLMRQEMAELEENIDRMTSSMRETEKGKKRE